MWLVVQRHCAQVFVEPAKSSLTDRRRRRERAAVFESLLPMSEIFVSLEQSSRKKVKKKKKETGRLLLVTHAQKGRKCQEETVQLSL